MRSVGSAGALKVIPTPRAGCAAIVLVPSAVPLITVAAIFFAESSVSEVAGVALAFVVNWVSRVPHCFCGGIAARAGHAAAKGARGAAEGGAGAVGAAGGVVVRVTRAETGERIYSLEH